MRVIFDTDIGDDIDDIWALGLLLSCKEVQLDLVTICFSDNTDYKTKVLEMMLSKFHATNIKIGVGRKVDVGITNCTAHPSVFKKKTKCSYPSAVNAMKELFDSTDDGFYIISAGPATNVADFAKSYPNYRDRYIVIAMGGAYKQGYINEESPSAEFNVLMDYSSANTAYSLTNYTLIPLDVCRDVVIDGVYYEKLLMRASDIAKEVLIAYREWQKNYIGGAIKYNINTSSSILYDVVPIHFLLHPENYAVERKTILATDKGEIVLDRRGSQVYVATRVEKERLLDFLIDKFTI